MGQPRAWTGKSYNQDRRGCMGWIDWPEKRGRGKICALKAGRIILQPPKSRIKSMSLNGKSRGMQRMCVVLVSCKVTVCFDPIRAALDRWRFVLLWWHSGTGERCQRVRHLCGVYSSSQPLIHCHQLDETLEPFTLEAWTNDPWTLQTICARLIVIVASPRVNRFKRVQG